MCVSEATGYIVQVCISSNQFSADLAQLESHQTIFLTKSWGLGKDRVVQKKTKQALITNMEMEIQEMAMKIRYAHLINL